MWRTSADVLLQTPVPSTTEPYVPSTGVIEQNEMFDFALKSAPSVLYGRFKQYGQVSHHQLVLMIF